MRRKVESLLAQDSGDKILDQPAAGLLLESTVTGLAVGMQMGPYRIERVLGKGGMGVVYRGVDTKLNRPVAVKFLSEALADPAARRRFQREARMASSLNHPHILTVYDAGELEGRQYLVTEFVDGGTLKDWAGAEKRTWRQIVELLVGVADGLAAAQAAGITHRDIKPANVLVARNGYAKLADFGLAKLAGVITAEETTLTLTGETTRPGVIVGTIAYMSPEQASGKPLDARSDVFSFGVVLYEMLAGRRPFAGATNSELVQTIIHGAPEPLGEEIPVALRTVVEKALEKDPADRYQAMREIVVDLRRLTRRSAETPASPMTRPGATTGHFFSFILRHGWELLHVRMCIWCVLLAYAAWRFRVAIPGVVGFAIFFAVLICTTVLSLLLSILLYTHVADKTHFAAEVRRMAPWIRFLSIVISLLAWVMAAIVAAPHILLAVFLTIMGTVLGVTVLTFKPSMDRLALSSQDLN